MSIGTIDWASLEELPSDQLKGEVFSTLVEASALMQESDTDDPLLLSVVPRLASLVEARSDLKDFREPLSALARAVGLLNYVDRSEASARDEIAAELAYVPELGITLHREQISALSTLLSGTNLILSAPTSFGKSILIDVLLLHERYRRVAIVLPTIALLDEFRRRLLVRFGKEFSILMHHSEKATHDRVIFLGTQERLINREDLGSLDLVVVDEFYKLDPSRRDERSVTLNAAVYRLLGRARQFFFLGPNIEMVTTTPGSRWRFEFLRTRFSTVAVDTYDLKSIPNKDERLHEEIQNRENWPALVFVSSPDKANKIAAQFAERTVISRDAEDLSKWMAENYGGVWELSNAVASGVAVHHGRVPRALASRFVRMFNDRNIPVMICTSTLIEGVNTAAKTVIIYDKTISRRPYDFFTFSNIRGRAGRLGKHHVGRVFLFHEPPTQEDVEVSAPLFANPDEGPDEYIVHLDEQDASPSITSRVEELAERIGLSPSEVRRFSGLGIEILIGLRAATNAAFRSGAPLTWSARPTYEQIAALCSVVCKVVPARIFGCGTDKQLSMYISKLRGSVTMKDFYQWHSRSYRGEAHNLDNVFKFLRSAEFSLPEYFGVVELFVKTRAITADYSLFLAELPRWFRSEPLKILEEQGVPIQISERFLRSGDTVTTLGARLRAEAASERHNLSRMEKQWIKDALPTP